MPASRSGQSELQRAQCLPSSRFDVPCCMHRSASMPHRRSSSRRLLVQGLGLALAGAAHAHASTHAELREPEGWITVTIENCNDSGPGSLRDAMATATLNTEFDLDQLACATITLTTGALADTAAVHSVRL